MDVGDHLPSILFFVLILFLIYLADNGKLNALMTIIRGTSPTSTTPTPTSSGSYNPVSPGSFNVSPTSGSSLGTLPGAGSYPVGSQNPYGSQYGTVGTGK